MSELIHCQTNKQNLRNTSPEHPRRKEILEWVIQAEGKWSYGNLLQMQTVRGELKEYFNNKNNNVYGFKFYIELKYIAAIMQKQEENN